MGCVAVRNIRRTLGGGNTGHKETNNTGREGTSLPSTTSRTFPGLTSNSATVHSKRANNNLNTDISARAFFNNFLIVFASASNVLGEFQTVRSLLCDIQESIMNYIGWVVRVNATLTKGERERKSALSASYKKDEIHQ